MSAAKLAAVAGLAALALSACGNSARPEAGSAAVTVHSSGRGRIDDPRKIHLTCLEQHHIPAVAVGRTSIQVGAAGSGPLIIFTPTPGAAQSDQIQGRVASAEVIGAALLYPNAATDQQLKPIEACVALSVKG